jgi:hypothetical protein
MKFSNARTFLNVTRSGAAATCACGAPRSSYMKNTTTTAQT